MHTSPRAGASFPGTHPARTTSEPGRRLVDRFAPGAAKGLAVAGEQHVGREVAEHVERANPFLAAPAARGAPDRHPHRERPRVISITPCRTVECLARWEDVWGVGAGCS